MAQNPRYPKQKRKSRTSRRAKSLLLGWRNVLPVSIIQLRRCMDKESRTQSWLSLFEEQELERWVCDCGLWDSDLGDLFLNCLQAGTSFRGNFEFLLFEYGKLEQLLFWSKICYKIVRRLLYYRAVYFLWQAEDFLSPAKSSLLRNHFPGENFSLWHLGLLHTRVTGYSFGCFIPWRSASMQFRHFPCFGALYGAKFFSTKSSLHGSIVSTTLSVRG